MSKARDIADLVSAGGILADGAIATTEITGVTATSAELNILDGVTATASELNALDGITATVTELNYTDGVTSAIQTQIDTKAPTASPTFTGTLAAPTINASTALQIGGTAITATAAELNILDGVTSTAAELNILDGVTATAAELNILDGVTATTAELNYNDITTLGTSEASKVVTADANGVVTFDNGITEESTVVTSSSNAATLNMRDGTNFTHTLSENVTYTFSNAASSGYVSSFTLKVIQDSTARTITWPTSVDWASATAPTLTTTSGGVDVFCFITYDGGTNWYGFTAGQAMG